MGVKAKDIIRRNTASFKSLLLILALLMGFQYGYAYLLERISENSKSVVSGVAMALSLMVTFFVVRKVIPWYEVELGDKTLVISKALFVKARPLIAIPVKEIKDVTTVEETPDFRGRKLNYTIYGIKDKEKMVIHWKREKGEVKVILQLSQPFAEKLKKEIIRVKKK